jgi:hypothetical protein
MQISWLNTGLEVAQHADVQRIGPFFARSVFLNQLGSGRRNIADAQGWNGDERYSGSDILRYCEMV